MTAFFDCEVAEIDAVRAKYGVAILNAWFDKSNIKARFKKARMRDQAFRCCYCRKFDDTTDNDEWDLEHILSEKHYPQFFALADNLALACGRCNREKTDKHVLSEPKVAAPFAGSLPSTSDAYSIVHPRLDDWDVHLRHIEYLVYEHKSDKGGVLMEICKLNKPAMAAVGLSYEGVMVSLRDAYAAIYGAPIERTVADQDVIEKIAIARGAGEHMRGKAALARLETQLARLDKAAAKRTPQIALLEASQLRSRAAVAKVRSTRLAVASPSRALVRQPRRKNP